MASIVVHRGVRVRVFGGSDGLKNTRFTHGMQWFILVQTIETLHPVADDPLLKSTQNLGGYNIV